MPAAVEAATTVESAATMESATAVGSARIGNCGRRRRQHRRE
jgi:hypothetical protein